MSPKYPGSANGTTKVVYSTWAQLLAVGLVLASVFPLPIYFVKNWPKDWRQGFRRVFLSGIANYVPDPSWYDKSRRIAPVDMEKLIRQEDIAIMKFELERDRLKKTSKA